MMTPGMLRRAATDCVTRLDSPVLVVDSVGRLQLRQPEVHDLDPARRADKQVLWLDVSVNDPLRVGRVETVGHLDGEAQQRPWLERPPAQVLAEGLAFEQLHRDEGPTVNLADLVDGADVGVIERRGGLGFDAEPLERRHGRPRRPREGT